MLGMRVVPSLIVGLVVSGTPAWAQSGGSSGAIHGSITDESGAALPGVIATLSSPALQVRQMTAVSDVTGNYRFGELPVGVYNITFELSGFTTFIRNELRLPVGFDAKVDVTMKISSLEESVTVTGDSPVIDVTTTTTSVTLNTEILNEIPRGRDLSMVYSMAPGVTLAGTPDVGGSNMANRQNISSGGVALQPKLQIEGMNIVLSDDQNSGVYFNSDTLEEIQIKTSGNDASVGVPGISMVGVIKSGGNSYHGLYSASYQSPKLQSDNLDDHLRSQGLTAVQPVKSFYDYQADLGGKILQDKLWFYLAYSKQQKNTGIAGFVSGPGPDGKYLTGDEPIAYATTGISQWAMKYSYLVNPNNRLNYVWQRGNKFVGEDGAGVLSPLEHTRDYSNPTSINRLEYQSTINSWSLFNVVGGYAGWWSDYSSYRQAEKYGFPLGPAKLDRESGLTTGPNAQNTALRPQDRYMVDAAYSFFPPNFLGGRHQFKAGVSYYHDHEAWYYPTNRPELGNYMLVFDRVNGVSGTPVQLQVSDMPVYPSDLEQETAIYLTDTWRLTDRITMNLGVRWDYQHVYLPEQSHDATPDFPTVWPAGDYPYTDLVKWSRTVPRVGIAYDGRSLGVFKLSAGLYGYVFGAQRGISYNRNALQTATFTWHDLNGDKLYQPGEVNLNLNGPDFVSVNGAIGNVMNPDLKQPLYQEYATSWEHPVAPSTAFSAAYTYRRSSDNYDIPGPNVARPLSVYNIPITRRDPGPDGILGNADDAGLPSVTFYDYDPAYRGIAYVKNFLVNSPLDNWFHTIEFTVTKRPSRRWQGSASYWLVKNHRWITNTFNAPQDYYNALDETWSWAGNFEVSYRLPWDLLAAANLQSKKGATGQRTVLFRTQDPDGGTPINQLSTVNVRVEPYGAQVGAPLNVFNIKVTKDFRIAHGKLGGGVDVFNVFNSNAPNQLLYASGPTYLYPTGVNGGILPARIARLTARFQF
ncbi:MAG TPA: carboxypeptidase regulatory-like domain-containing protein [Vicinamibacterales bacterium]|nr:carboxypeptidase regulatory-like domain-containing protein [Vicinamibacterales bacterium]